MLWSCLVNELFTRDLRRDPDTTLSAAFPSMWWLIHSLLDTITYLMPLFFYLIKQKTKVLKVLTRCLYKNNGTIIIIINSDRI